MSLGLIIWLQENTAAGAQEVASSVPRFDIVGVLGTLFAFLAVGVTRHTFAFRLMAETRADAYELERRLGHRSQRYIRRYTNPSEDVATEYVEGI